MLGRGGKAALNEEPLSALAYQFVSLVVVRRLVR